MKGDFKFSSTAVRKGSRYRAARYAVLSPFYGLTWHEDETKAMWHLLAKWRARLGEYVNAGWSQAQSAERLVFLRNCPPFGLRIKQKARVCNSGGMLCPFCYARSYPIRMYNFLEERLYGGTKWQHDDGEVIRPPQHLRLIEFQARSDLMYQGENWGPQAIKDMLDEYLPGMRQTRRREIDMFGDCVGTVLWRVEVYHNRLTLTRSGLIATYKYVTGKFVPKSKSSYNKFWYREHPAPGYKYLTKTIIAGAVGRVASYPTQMFSASANEVLGVVEALKGFRMLATYGGHDQKTLLKDVYRDVDGQEEA